MLLQHLLEDQPVWLVECFATVSGVPSTMILPTITPGPGLGLCPYSRLNGMGFPPAP